MRRLTHVLLSLCVWYGYALGSQFLITPTHEYSIFKDIVLCTNVQTGKEQILSSDDYSFYTLATDNTVLFALLQNDRKVFLNTYSLPDLKLLQSKSIPLGIMAGSYGLGNADLIFSSIETTDAPQGTLFVVYNSTLYLISRDLTPLGRIPINHFARGIYIHQNTLYLWGAEGELSTYDILTGKLTLVFYDPSHPQFLFTPLGILSYGPHAPTLNFYGYEDHQSINSFTLPQNPWTITCLFPYVYILGAGGCLYTLDLHMKELTLSDQLPDLGFSSVTHDGFYLYIHSDNQMTLYNPRTHKCLSRPHDHGKSSLKVTTNTHLIYGEGKKTPIFPRRPTLRTFIHREQLKDYAFSLKASVNLKHSSEEELKIPTDFRDFIGQIEGVGRLSYECIFDFLAPEFVPLIIYYLSVKESYLKSGEWTLRKAKLYDTLFYRLWMGDATRAEPLLKGLVLLKDPIALKLID